MAKLTGMGGSLTLVSDPDITFCVESWTVTLNNDVQDVTDTCSVGWIERIGGVSDASLSASMWYDPAQVGGGQITLLFTGALISFVADIGNSGNTIAGNFIVSTVGVENGAKPAVKLTFTALSSGQVTITE